MNLRQGLSTLSKSSPYAVTTKTTKSKSESPELHALKEYLFVETDIERKFKELIQELHSNQILFLCGSSGDGKSEILTRYYKKYIDLIDFHLDATHSFHPKSTAVDTLDDVFAEHKRNFRPLAVGINIGMLGNYAEEGAGDHEEIKQSIKQFLDTKNPKQKNYYFLDFEAFPKFDLTEDVRTSDFLEKVLTKITKHSESNPIYKLFLKEQESGEQVLCSNYKLLSINEVQEVIIDLLLRARLERDQFITARSLLDFIYTLLVGKDYLFDNLFRANDNELGEKITEFDPCAIRSKKLDLFILQRQLALPSEEFGEFIAALSDLGIKNSLKEYSLIRLFYILKDHDFSNNFHQQFAQDFSDQLIEQYARMWNLHSNFTGVKTEKAYLKTFYKEIVLAAINLYANRNTGNLQKDEFFISEHGGWYLTAELELNVDYHSIDKKKERKQIGYFYVFLKVNDRSLNPIPVTINLLDLMCKIVRGYRPNKHDKNVIVLLDEIVDQIIEVANESRVLYLHADKSRIKLKEADNDDIEVSGL